MFKPVLICTVLVLVLLELSFGFSAENTLTEIEDIRDKLEETADTFETILDDTITPLLDNFNTIFDTIEELLKKIGKGKY